MEPNITKKNIFLINLLKFKRKGKVNKIDIEEKMKNKNRFILDQLSYLSIKTKYSKELERLSREKKTKIILYKKKSELHLKKEINNLNKNQRIIKGASNKMILDIIFNNQKFKNYFLSKSKDKNKIIYLDLNGDNENMHKNNIKTIKSYPNLELTKCQTDNIQLISGKNNYHHNKIFNKLRHSISSFSFDMNNMKFKNFPYLNKNSFKLRDNAYKLTTKKSAKNINENSNNKYINHSEKLLNIYNNSKRNERYESDELKGMLTINYDNYKRKRINLKKNISNYNYNIFKKN